MFGCGFFFAFLRLVELEEGSITVDDVDIGNIGLHDLREKVAMIPQAGLNGALGGVGKVSIDAMKPRIDHAGGLDSKAASMLAEEPAASKSPQTSQWLQVALELRRSLQAFEALHQVYNAVMEIQ
eukprot:symbB.v1.2.021367.t1/scaffold1843.1/size100617/3